MKVQTNIPLKTMTTMRLGGIASYVADVTTPEELQKVYQNAKKLSQPVFVIGGGSNLIVHDEGFPGLIVRMKIPGIEVVEENDKTVTLSAGGGVIWDDLVKYTVDRDLQGIEAMSGIPGTVGAAPVQNIGAYGQELSYTFASLEAYDTQADRFVRLSWDDCGFSYRTSIFRTTAVGRFIISKVTLILNKKRPEPPFYDALQKYFVAQQIDPEYLTVKMIRDAVLEIRSDKLPDPAQLPNSGSFFKNAIVETWKANDIKSEYEDMPTYPTDNEGTTKIPAGWLIESLGYKGQLLSGMRVHKSNAVVLINESANSYADLAAARQEIVNEVRDKYQIVLEQEPLELLPPRH